jgi:hypothetical protein
MNAVGCQVHGPCQDGKTQAVPRYAFLFPVSGVIGEDLNARVRRVEHPENIML